MILYNITYNSSFVDVYLVFNSLIYFSWEEVDNFGNIYNRLVLFNSHNVHAVTEYFGDNINNSRLFQLFFFNVKSV